MAQPSCPDEEEVIFRGVLWSDEDNKTDGASSLPLCHQLWNLGQHILQLEVVQLHNLIEIQLDALLGQGQQAILLPLLAFAQHLSDLPGLLTGGAFPRQPWP